eukprot:3573024-Pleurochrysis_carterae.AAC.1
MLLGLYLLKCYEQLSAAESRTAFAVTVQPIAECSQACVYDYKLDGEYRGEEAKRVNLPVSVLLCYSGPNGQQVGQLVPASKASVMPL